jgi:hypothetical protein
MLAHNDEKRKLLLYRNFKKYQERWHLDNVSVESLPYFNSDMNLWFTYTYPTKITFNT